MLQAIEAIIDPNGTVRWSEPLQIAHPMRAVITLMQPIENKGNYQTILDLLNSPLFANAPEGDPVAMEKTIRANRNAWD
jgi:hypothetical protein